jgi:hypothetical protein
VGIAALLREALVVNYLDTIRKRLRRNALARFYHWLKLNLLAPLPVWDTT